MEDKKITPQESMELISSMISATRNHFTKGEGNMLLFWGYLCVAVALVYGVCVYLEHGVGIPFPFSTGLIWWLIPVIGIPYTIIVNRSNRSGRMVVTYTDRMTINLWNYVLWLAIAAIVIGMLFFVSGFPVWYVIELFTFFVVGMASSVQGMIIKEKSMIYGGAFSVLSGGFLMAGVLAYATWLQAYSLILFIISFIVMMIIPGHILNHKAKRGL